ncbi:MAG TPA: hypothetical protein VFG14_12130 [Chthoniobacteraceae bacterium]|nr:hypothetical protein [Chthoniobacteraceae bacterium]
MGFARIRRASIPWPLTADEGKMTISTSAIQARHALGRAQAGDYIDWAVDALALGSDSPNLRILAGLDRFISPFEAEEHFKKARKELGLSAPGRQQAILDYAISLAETILEPGSDYQTIVSKLAELCHSNEYPDFLMEWYSVEDGLADIRAGCYPYGYEALYQADPRKIVTNIAQAFIVERKQRTDRSR